MKNIDFNALAKEAYESAKEREKLILRAFFADCKRYLDEDLKPKNKIL